MIKRIVNYIGDKENTGTLKKLLGITLVIIVVADYFAERHHVAFFWDEIPGWWAFYGFIACIILILVPKTIGHLWLMKEEDYYDE